MNQTEAPSPVMVVSLVRSHPWLGLRSIEMVRDGESVLFQTYGFGQPAEIGAWRHVIPSSLFEDFVLRLDGLSRAVPEEGLMMPGQMTTAFEVTRAGEVEPTHFSFHPNQPELPEVLKSVSAIEAELRNYPSRVLRGEARWRKEVLRRDETAMLDVILSNPGSQRMQIENPAWEGPLETSGLRLWLRAEEGGNTAVDVLAKDVQVIDVWAVTPELVLAPGQQVSFAVRTSLTALAAGRCKTGLDIRSDRGESAARAAVSGRLSIDLGTITVIDHSGSPPM